MDGKCWNFQWSCEISIFGLISTTVILVIHFTTKAPHFYLSSLHLPPSPGNLTYNLQIRNMAKLVGVRYHDLVFSVRDGGNITFNASVTIPGFNQGLWKTNKVDGELQGGWTASTGSNRTSPLTAAAKLVVVRVDGSFRYQAWILWKSKKHEVKVGGNVVVNSTVGDAFTGGRRIQLLTVNDPPPPPPSGASSHLRWCGGVASSLMAATTLHLLAI